MESTDLNSVELCALYAGAMISHPRNLNPDKDTKTKPEHSAEEFKNCENTLLKEFEEVLNDANYEKLSEAELQYAMERVDFIPKADLEMLFSNAKIKMKLKDKLMLGVRRGGTVDQERN